MKTIILAIVLISSHTAIAAAVAGSHCTNCEATLPSSARARALKPILQLATVFGPDTRRPVLSPTKTTARWPVGRTSTEGRPASGSFISPCLFITAFHVIAKSDDGTHFDYLDITNETTPEGKFLIPIDPIVGKFLKSGEPVFLNKAGIFETEHDMVVVDTYPNCRGAVDGMVKFIPVPPSREEKNNELVMYTSAYDAANRYADGKTLVRDAGCNPKYIIRYRVYHDCPSTEAASGGPLLIKVSIDDPEINEAGYPLDSGRRSR